MGSTLPGTLRLGPVHLTVTDLDRSVAWYENALGMQQLRSEDGLAAMGAGEEVVVLHSEPEAKRAGRHAGLYHYALLFGTREELARVAVRVAAAGTPVQDASDHETHEAIYLSDPDGNGIELAADRPREQWPPSLGYAGGPQPLDVNGLLETVAGEEPSARARDGLRVGHLHLHVGSIDEALRWYRDVVGFDEMANIGTAAFVSAGGYHHHLGFNVWNGEGVGGPPPGSVGLREWTIELPRADVEALAQRAGTALEDGSLLLPDPWGTQARFVAIN